MLGGEILGSRMRSCFYLYNEIANFKGGVEDKVTPILFVYIHLYSRCCTPRYIRQRGIFVSRFILLTVFGDTSYTMSMTSPCAFLVAGSKHITNADFGGLISGLSRERPIFL